MSRINSWARPPKRGGAPPPLYLLPGGELIPYCQSCGRVIGKAPKNQKDTVKYCSERCRRQKPSEADRQIEQTFVALLNGMDLAKKSPDDLRDILSSLNSDQLQLNQGPQAQTGSQMIVSCNTVQNLLFGQHNEDGSVPQKAKKRRGVQGSGEWKSVDMEDTEPFVARPMLNVNSSQSVNDLILDDEGEALATEELKEDDEEKQRHSDGQKQAEQRESVRRAARRLCAFGTLLPASCEKSRQHPYSHTSKRRASVEEGQAQEAPSAQQVWRKCEPVLKSGTVVEASFAKGDWGIRWREE